ncbi:MAG: class 1 fructose-bisphosphatase [Marinospirillum sp.]|uniref:class 1 fructose-bisphosphatase n=1 Tax=Marinospirillum sp. TaxID=2183934 RepID=UPI0019FC4BFE|nr:class 1 fructose-bisphosphatase [Marinospirillum sp.]MBE0507270.1 class 1 fructose-bisphosphatase [Marinospirillum sp.]
MQILKKTTLTQYLIEERRRYPDADGQFNALILDVALACKAISAAVAQGELANLHGNYQEGDGESINIQGETQKKLDVLSNDYFIQMNEWGGNLAGMASEEMEAPYQIPKHYPKGKYLLVFDPLDGSSNIDVNVSIGSIFSILRQKNPAKDQVCDEDFFQPGNEQVAAGYALYGPTTMLVLSVGQGVVGFTLDRVLGEFMLTHEKITINPDTQEFAINASNSRFWEPPIKRYIAECLEGETGPRGKNFNMRWIASMVAEAHRILMRGGVFMYPRDNKDPSKAGKLRLLYEACPIGFLIEQAGGRISTGRAPLLEIQPDNLHQRIGVILGSKNEVERIEAYHQEDLNEETDASPLFGNKGLFRE